MKSKISNILFVCACSLGMSGSLYSQDAAAARGIQGYLDPRTGVFHSLPGPVGPDGEPQASTTYTGKFVFNFTITLSSTLSSSAKIGCQVNADVVGEALNTIQEAAAVQATRSGTSTTATCTVTIPYSWNLASASTDKVVLSYTIEAVTGTVPSRTSSQTIGYISVPTSGTTTTETATPTI